MFEEYLKNVALKINIELSNEQSKNFEIYKNLLLVWNTKMNLTSITEEKEIIIKHFIDSLMLIKYLNKDDKIIDIGTGAGFPGIPLKIVKKDLEVTLLDSLNKRINFLDNVIQELKLSNIKTIHGRTEEIALKEEYREKFDVATARAVARLNVLMEYCLPYVKKDGIFICMKGPNIKEEINEAKKAIEILGGRIENVQELELPEIHDKRTIIIIRKIKQTPKKYPRKAGIPSKQPIL